MRKITAGLFISLDGVVEAPETWHFDYFNDEMGEAVGRGMATSDAMLLGRTTYEMFAGFWPGQPSDVQPADYMNGVHHYVVSNTLEKGTWEPTTIISGDVKAQLEALTAGPGQDINVIGSPTLVASLIDMGLLDELSLLIHPVVVGKGKRLFDPTSFGPKGLSPMKLLSSTTFETGVLHNVYGPGETPTTGQKPDHIE
jgi:dihydrofolate reductase